jgi:hypothetical protein
MIVPRPIVTGNVPWKTTDSAIVAEELAVMGGWAGFGVEEPDEGCEWDCVEGRWCGGGRRRFGWDIVYFFCLFLRGGRKGDVDGVIEIVSESFAEVEALKFGVGRSENNVDVQFVSGVVASRVGN